MKLPEWLTGAERRAREKEAEAALFLELSQYRGPTHEQRMEALVQQTIDELKALRAELQKRS